MWAGSKKAALEQWAGLIRLKGNQVHIIAADLSKGNSASPVLAKCNTDSRPIWRCYALFALNFYDISHSVFTLPPGVTDE